YCRPGARPLDIVDIGMPTERHQALGAAINGTRIPVRSIVPSKYVDNAYEIPLGAGTIAPGREGVFEFTGRSYGMVWQDTTDPELASFRFGTTWFGANFVKGETLLTVRFRLPIPKEDLEKVHHRILYHRKDEAKWAKAAFEGEKVVSVGWGRKVRFTQQHTFSVSFPKKYVNKVRKMTIWGLFYRWFKGSPGVQLVSAIIVLIAFGIIFFTTTRGTGWSLFIILTVALCVAMWKSPGFHLALYPIML
ncbi:unnamed protein product, partial [marine sediment metagenome]